MFGGASCVCAEQDMFREKTKETKTKENRKDQSTLWQCVLPGSQSQSTNPQRFPPQPHVPLKHPPPGFSLPGRWARWCWRGAAAWPGCGVGAAAWSGPASEVSLPPGASLTGSGVSSEPWWNQSSSRLPTGVWSLTRKTFSSSHKKQHIVANL